MIIIASSLGFSLVSPRARANAGNNEQTKRPRVKTDTFLEHILKTVKCKCERLQDYVT